MKRVRFIGILVIVVAAGTGAIWAHTWYRTAQRNAQCVRNLVQIGTALRAYTNESDGEYFPPLSRVAGQLMFDPDAVYPTYLNEPLLLVSPFHPDCARLREQDSHPASLIDDGSYWYLGYIFANERSALAWINEYKNMIPGGQLPLDISVLWPDFQDQFDGRDREMRARYDEAVAQARADWIASGQEGEPPKHVMMLRNAVPFTEERHEYHVLREGVERFLMTEIMDPWSGLRYRQEAPVMVERPELHGDGGHVLYMDGHVEFVPYPGPFPMTVTFIDGLRSLDRMGGAE